MRIYNSIYKGCKVLTDKKINEIHAEYSELVIKNNNRDNYMDSNNNFDEGKYREDKQLIEKLICKKQERIHEVLKKHYGRTKMGEGKVLSAKAINKAKDVEYKELIAEIKQNREDFESLKTKKKELIELRHKLYELKKKEKTAELSNEDKKFLEGVEVQEVSEEEPEVPVPPAEE